MSQILVLYMGSLILRSIGIALVAGICSWKICNVAVRHAVWVVVLGAMLLMPAADYLLPASWVPARVQQIAAEQPMTFRVVSARPVGIPRAPALASQPEAALPVQSSPLDWWSIAAVLYVLMALAMFTRLVIGYRKMRKLRNAGSAISSRIWDEIIAPRRVRWRIPLLLESEAVQVPMTVGLVRPAVILPIDWKAWDDWKLRAVLLHELEHVRRADWGIAVVAAAAKCAYWLNPISWFLERQLSQLAEHASDDATLNCTQNPTRYAEILLEFAVAAQSGGRLMKGGVAMAQRNMTARIERALGNPKTGTGIVRIAGWALATFIALPVIYSAAALQVASDPVKAPVPTYSAEFGWNPMPQPPSAAQQAAPQSAPAIVAKVQQNAPNPAVDPRTVSQQMEVVKQQLQQAYKANEFFQEVQKYNQAPAGPVPEPQNSSVKSAATEFLKAEVARLESQLATLKVQSATAPQGQANPPAPPQPSALPDLHDALLDLPDNEDDLLAYLRELARRRIDANSFIVSFTGIQARTVSMKVGGQDFTFGCDSCSFFVGESVVSSAVSTPPGPGILVRLNSDGNALSITCRARNCRFGDQGGNAGPEAMRLVVSGDSETFAVSKLPSVVIFRN